jgi:hypothetical protein
MRKIIKNYIQDLQEIIEALDISEGSSLKI